MAGSFREQLELVVTADVAAGEKGLTRLTGAAERTATAAKEAGASIEQTAQRVAEARAKEADAAGAVRVAEQRLIEVRARYGDESSQTLAAEEKLAGAQRRHHVATREVERATEAQTAAERKVTTATKEHGEATEGLDLNMRELAERAAALAGGVALGDWLKDSIGGFIEGARASSAMATSMNATVEQAGAFLTLVGSVGLELDDLIEIQAEFATKTHDGLTLLGDELQHNTDGTVNWTQTLADTLTHLQGITDATERNRLGFAMFGEEGYKQLSRLLNTGVSVEDALAQIGTPFTDEDVAAVKEYDRMMMSLSQQAGGFGRTLGRAVLPVLSGLVDAGQDIADVIGAIPGPILAAGAASVLLGIGMRRAGTEGTFLAGALARATAAAAAYRFTAATAGRGSAILGAGLGGAASAGRGLMDALGGPLGIALIAGGALWEAASAGADALKESAHDAAVELAKAEAQSDGTAESIDHIAQRLAEEGGEWENLAAAMRGTAAQRRDLAAGDRSFTEAAGAFGFTGLAVTAALADADPVARGYADAIKEARDALKGADEEQAVAQIATRSLNDLIAEGTTSGSEFADAVSEAAQAQADQSHTTDVANASIAAYNATTRDAIETLLGLARAQLGQRSGWQDVLTSMQDAKKATDDASTAADEVEQAYIDLIGTVLDYGGASADAAVEAARAAGTVLDPLTEAKIRADATIKALRESLDAPNLTDRARGEIQGMIDKLSEAQASGNIEAVMTLTGADEVKGEADEAAQPRQATIKVESRNGPAVDDYLDGLASARRLAIVRVESRNGPAVRAYLEGLAIAQRLALIRVESRGGPAVNTYLDRLAAKDRLAIIRVETRGGPAVQQYLDNLASAARVASIGVGGAGLRGGPGAGSYGGAVARLGSVELDLKLTGSLDRGQVARAERGRAYVEDIRAYEQRNGTGWRRGGRS